MNALVFKGKFEDKEKQMRYALREKFFNYLIEIPEENATQKYHKNKVLIEIIKAAYDIFPSNEEIKEEEIVIQNYKGNSIGASINKLIKHQELLGNDFIIDERAPQIACIKDKNLIYIPFVTTNYKSLCLKIGQVVKNVGFGMATPRYEKVSRKSKNKKWTNAPSNGLVRKIFSPVLYLDARINGEGENLYENIPLHHHIWDSGKFNDIGVKLIPLKK